MSQKASPVARNHELKKGEIKEDDDDYVSDSDDEDEEFSIWFELKTAWKQHFIAIFVAFLAASMGFFHLQEFTSSALLKNILPHAHLESYRRMANISFCDSSDVNEGYFLFEIPKKHLSSLESHYEGDEFGQQELKCAQAQTQQGSLLKGLSPLYTTPTLEDITPIVSAVTNKNEKKIEAASLSFTGFGAKFVNLSPTPKLLFWDGRAVDDQRLVAEIPPMESIGTATTPGQSFSLTPVYDASSSLQRWTVTADEPILVYRSESEKVKDDVLQHKLQLQELNLVFAREYLIQTKRPWFSNFPRPPPSHPFWPADYLGQTHRVTAGDGDFTLKVSSVAPRVLEIDNFLTEQECQTLIATAQAKGLHPSTVVGDSAKNNAMVDSTTRSSTTTWLSRTHHELVDTIYRRAAHVFQVDDAVLRHYHHEDAKYHSLAEELQIVRYASGQEYTPHHDYVVPSISDPHQPSRFATLLLYLQAPTRGGETTFPRALQAHNHDGLVVPPLTGKAILFYNLLPDGNVDDVSQHGSNAVVDGEKWIANLWIWDPMIG
mmetsp:Transcript_27437/g.41542  ORF Transcript_27437/g.41542 Transcript_27437/m.41542 type:complete len:546 (+) Transcript_27437:149-1786(+)